MYNLNAYTNACTLSLKIQQLNLLGLSCSSAMQCWLIWTKQLTFGIFIPLYSKSLLQSLSFLDTGGKNLNKIFFCCNYFWGIRLKLKKSRPCTKFIIYFNKIIERLRCKERDCKHNLNEPSFRLSHFLILKSNGEIHLDKYFSIEKNDVILHILTRVRFQEYTCETGIAIYA